MLGNARLPHRQAILGFADGLAWVAQIGLFVLLGLLVSPGRLGDALVPALVVGWRWCCWPGRCRCWSRRWSAAASRAGREPVGWRGSAFLSWAGLRGAVPIVLATIPLSSGTPGADAPVRRGLRAGDHLHPGAGRHAGAGRPAAAG